MLFSSFQIYHACVSAYILLLQVITLTAPRVIIDEKELVRENSQRPEHCSSLLFWWVGLPSDLFKNSDRIGKVLNQKL